MAKTKSYKVKMGDRLSAIAKKYGLSVTELAKMNNIKRPYILKKGQVLTIVPKTTMAKKSTSKKKAVSVRKKEPSLSRGNLIFLKLVLLSLFIVLIVLLVKLYKTHQYKVSQLKKPGTLITTVSPDKVADDPTAKEEVEVPTTTPEPEATPEPAEEAPAVVETSIDVHVLNGSGRKGEANIIKNLLRGENYTVPKVGNAANFSFTETIIEHNPDHVSDALAIQQIMSTAGYEVVLSEKPDLNYIVVTIGKTKKQ